MQGRLRDCPGCTPVLLRWHRDCFGGPLRRINDNVLLTLSWEVNPGCIDFTSRHFLANIDILDVQRRIEDATQAAAGPPCPDFSQLRAAPPGIEGATGWLFQRTLNIEHMIRFHFTGVPIETVIENVLPTRRSRTTCWR